MSVDFSPEINNFMNAELGEEVRGSLVDIAEALETAINSQLITVDPTLTESRQGADAAITGEEIDNLADGIDTICLKDIINTNTWTVGSLAAQTGGPFESTNRLRTNNFISVSDGVFVINVNQGYEFLVYAYSSGGTYIGCLKDLKVFDTTLENYKWVNSYALYEHPDYKYKFVLRKLDGTDMQESDGDNCLYAVRLSADASEVTNAMVYNGTIAFKYRSGYITEIDGHLNINSPLSSEIGYWYGIMPCSPGDKFCVSGKSYSGIAPMAWYFIAGDYTVLSKANPGDTVNSAILTAPPHSAYCIVHTLNPSISSFKGLSIGTKIENNSKKISLLEEGKQLFELGAMDDIIGVEAVKQFKNRIRSVNILSLNVYETIIVPEGYYLVCYAYDDNMTYLGYITTIHQVMTDKDIQNEYPSAMNIRLVISNIDHPSWDHSQFLEYVTKTTKYVIKRNPYAKLYPELSLSQKNSIKNLADSYFAIRDNFTYLTSATLNDYANSDTIYKDGKFKLCCSLFASLIWMGRDATDLATIGSYSNTINKAFDFGYYCVFADRYLYGKTKENGDYFGFQNPLGYTEADGNANAYRGAFSWNSYYHASDSAESVERKKQIFNPFLFANDMAKELDRLGYTIPISELQTGDLIFTRLKSVDIERNPFDFVAYKNINHVALVYDRTPTSLVIMESTTKDPDHAIIKSSSNGTDFEKLNISNLRANTVMCARLPAAWGVQSNVPSAITRR